MQVMTKTLSTLALLFIVATTFCPEPLFAEDGTPEKKGWLRDKIKDRWAEKQAAKSPPVASTDVTLKITKSGDTTFSIQHGSATRYYRLHVPKSYSPTKPTALVVALHGGGGDMDIQADGDAYRLIAKSESAGFIVVFPNGFSQFKSGKIATWNAGACCAHARDAKVDDVGFLRQVIQNLKGQLNIDSEKVFATGMSNGAMMAYRLACEMPDTIKAIAAVAGTDNTLSCAPTKGLPILHIHAKNDDSVLFGGGAGKGSVEKAFVTDYKSVDATIEKWRAINQCGKSTRRILEKKGAYCELTSDCKNGAVVQLCVTETGGHSWPGGSKPRRMGGSTPSTALSAADVMWDFFSGSTANETPAPKP